MDKIFDLKTIIVNTLDSNKALDIVSIELANKSSIADYMIIASGTSSRHIQALAEAMWDARNESTPKLLQPGQWHIPFGDKFDRGRLRPFDVQQKSGGFQGFQPSYFD